MDKIIWQVVLIMGVDIGSKIVRKRQELLITQRKLAEMAGIAQSTLSYIENGKKRPQFDTMSAICRVLGISVLELLTFDEPQAANKFFEESLEFRNMFSGSQQESKQDRLLAFEKYLYSLYTAQTGS